MPFTVLTNNDVRRVLDSLTKQDVLNLHNALAEALYSYSTATDPEDSECCASGQPLRISVKSKEGLTTLFMPAKSDNGMGVKIVTLAAPKARDDSSDDVGAPPTRTSTGSSHSSMVNAISKSGSRSSSPTLPKSPTLSSSSPSLSKSSTASFRLTVPIMETPRPRGAATCPKGSITLLSPTGTPRAVLNAEILTPFRTALASTLLLKVRQSVHTLIVFGAGAQAYWHIYLALLLRGPEIHHLHVINRSFASAQNLMETFATRTPNRAVADIFLYGKLTSSILTSEYGEYARLLKEHVRAADVLFCCTPSTVPLFPGEYLTNSGGRKKGRYIAAIGSYLPHMQEIPAEVLRQAVAPPEREHGGAERHHLHVQQKQAHEGGAVVVDTIEGAMKEAGELIIAGIGGEAMVELGELVMLRKSDRPRAEEKRQRSRSREPLLGNKKKAARHNSKDRKGDSDGGFRDWLERGNVIYKCVGMGLMDVVVGMEIVRLAEERGIGTTVHDF